MFYEVKQQTIHYSTARCHSLHNIFERQVIPHNGEPFNHTYHNVYNKLLNSIYIN